MKDQFLALINNVAVHRVDVFLDGTKNTRDYAYGKAHYSVGDKFKAEITFADKEETIVKNIVIKNKTFNTIVATYSDADSMAAFKHALDNRAMVTRFNSTRGAVMQSELGKMANRLH
ncbi:MAG: hypothetical protein E7009_00760 [Alphaproteobacteria bacterium]|nr:hypothetical protein [Alphaproteobacteria bacterium]MBQ3039490.1 hypothetical protein [Alphaproteobacteria bacterium]MBQ7127395.1 hypothetical protein [Alphaproteobacteria bacterium]